MAGFSIKVKGLEVVSRELKSLPAKLQAQVLGEIQLAAEEAKRNAVKEAPADTGKLRQSVVVTKGEGVSSTVSVQTFYAPYMEFGTKKKARVPSELAAYAARFKGSRPSPTGLKLNEAIYAWVKRKGIGGKMTKSGRVSRSASSQAQQKMAALFIARKIYRDGVEPHPFFFKNVFAARDKLIQRIIQLVKRL